MANTTIKITQLPSIGNGLSASTLLPVVNTSGTAVTEKVTVGAVANYVLTQAGNTLSPAFLSTIAYSVSNASQPNITSVGTLSVNTLKISGGIVGYYLQTDGSGNLTWAPGGGGNGAVGGINTSVQFNDAGDFGANTGFTFNKTTGIFTSPFLAGNGNGLSNIQGANVSGFVPNANVANTAFSVAGANVSGFVPNANVANTAIAVAAANVSGLGNIATINLTGSTTNVLYGNGVFAAVTGGSYGNSDVANYLPTFTGNIGANVVTANLFSGNGTNLTNIAGANVSGFVPNANVANTAFAVAAANVSGLGNIATINLTGSTTNVLYGNGVFAAVTGGSYGNSDVANYLPTFTGNVGAGNVNVTGTVYANGISSTGLASLTTLNVSTTANLGAVGNVKITGGTNGYVLQTDGAGNLTWTAQTGGSSNAVPGGANTEIQFNDAGSFAGNSGFTFNKTTGIFTSPFLAGNGNGLSNIQGANVSGFVPNANVANTAFAVAAANVSGLGNIATINLTGSTTNVLYGNGVFAPVSGGSGTPGGSNTQIQFNDSGNFGANSGFTFDSTTGNIGIPGIIIGSNTIEFDNRASGNSADINLYSADDILIQARDRAIGSTAEGGDINIFAGDSAEDSDTSAGDIVIEAGRGGASNLDSGGDGGFIRIEAGQGGNAVGANISAQGGGSLTLNAGNAGTNNGNIDLGSAGGDVSINAGDSTGNGNPGGDIILRSGDAGANALAGQIQLIISSSDNGDGGTWTFNGAGIFELPNSGTIGNEGNNIDIGSSNAISLEASSAVNIYTDTGTAAWQWQFQDDGNLRLPTIELDVGNTINEQTVIQSQRKIIPGLRYSAEIVGTTPTVVYTATSIDTTSMKVTMQIQHTGLGFEFFDVSATSTGGDTFYTVSNRVQPPTIDNSTVVVDLNGSNIMEITVTINSGAANSWVTYDATEFGIAVD